MSRRHGSRGALAVVLPFQRRLSPSQTPERPRRDLFALPQGEPLDLTALDTTALARIAEREAGIAVRERADGRFDLTYVKNGVLIFRAANATVLKRSLLNLIAGHFGVIALKGDNP